MSVKDIMDCIKDENQQSYDSWGIVNRGNLLDMIERTEKFKPLLLKMGSVLYNIIEKYNAQQGEDAKVF